MNFNTRYQQLNSKQRQAVDTIDGPVMVVAGPGTGKTELLGMRVANILKQTDTLPENILCLTFTESGANAMRMRLVDIIGQAAYKVAIHTFHSFGSEIINQNSEFFYRGAVFQPADELRSYEILESIFDELTYSDILGAKMNDEYTYLRDTAAIISDLKRSGLASSEVLALLDDNETAMDSIESDLASIFANRIGATTLSLLIPVTQKIAEHQSIQILPDITPLSHVIATSLAHAVDSAQEQNSTKPVTEWKNTWLEKDTSGTFVFKSRKRQAKLRAATSLYDSYITRMHEAKLFDFDDMILEVVHTLETQTDLRYNLQEKFQYIMVDEFQDTNLAQSRILHSLTNDEISNGRPNILVVGDDDQAIYSFQGADVSNIINFRTAYAATQLITLTDNYRSSMDILDSARHIIKQGNDRLENYIEELDKQLVAQAEPVKTLVSQVSNVTARDERAWIANDIATRIEAGQQPASITVIARRHQELIDLLPYLIDRNIAVAYEKQDNILDSDIIMQLELLSRVMWLLASQRMNEANVLLPQILAHPAWNIPSEQLWKLSLTAHKEQSLWLETMQTTPELQGVANWFIAMISRVHTTSLEQILDQLIGYETLDEDLKSPYYEYYFSSDERQDRSDRYLEHLKQLQTIRHKLREHYADSSPTLEDFLLFIDLHRSSNTPIMLSQASIDNDQSVNLMTAHKSKGLEFNTVYILNATDTTWGEKVRSRHRLIGFPENLPLAPVGGSLDERLRLFYVAMTRAKQELIISYSTTGDNGKVTLPASFLLSSAIDLQTNTTIHSVDSELHERQLEWFTPIVHPVSLSMKETLQTTLDRYKLSATHLNAFIDITRGGPEHFLITNLLRFPSAMSPAAAFGSAIHATLHQAHSHLKATGEHRPLEDILNDFEEHLARCRLSPSDHEQYIERGHTSLSAFLSAKYESFSSSQRTELQFGGQHAMLEGAHLTGALDLVNIDEQAKTIYVTDYKTGKASVSWQGKADYEKIKLHKYKQQLMFYKLLVEASRDYSKYTVSSGSLEFVEPNESGNIITLDFSFSDDELADFRKLIQSIWRHITNLDLPDISQYEQSYKGILAFEQDLIDEDK